MSEAAGVNSAAGSFGHSFGLAFAGAIMLATLSVTWSPGHLVTFTTMAASSAVLSPHTKNASPKRWSRTQRS